MAKQLNEQLATLLGDEEKAKEVLALVKAVDPVKKYHASEKGKAARKRANQKYYNEHGKLEKGTVEDISLFLQAWCEDHMNKVKAWGILTDDELRALPEDEQCVTITATKLWHAFCDEPGFPAMTRKRFISLLPEGISTVSTWKDEAGKKMYSPALKINIVSIGWPKQA